MQNVRPTADSFGRIVTNVVQTFFFNRVDHTATFMAGSAPVNLWIPTQLTLVLHLMGGDLDLETGRESYLDTVTIVPNTDEYEPEHWDLLDRDGLVIGSFKGIEAAVGAALTRVCVRNWYAGVQDAHDLVAV